MVLSKYCKLPSDIRDMNWDFALLLNSIRSLPYHRNLGLNLPDPLDVLYGFLMCSICAAAKLGLNFVMVERMGIYITYGLVVNSTFSYRHQKQFSFQDMREVTDLIHGLRSSKLLGAFRDKSYLKGHISWIISTFHYSETRNVYGTPSIQKQAKIRYRCRYDHGNPYSGFGFYLTRHAHQKVYTGLP